MDDLHFVWFVCVATGTRNGPAGQCRSKPRELCVCWSDPDQEPAGWLSAKTGAKRPGTGTSHRRHCFMFRQDESLCLNTTSEFILTTLLPT